MSTEQLENMSNLVANIFKIEKSPTLKATIPALISFLKWSRKAGPEQDSLRRAVKVWFIRAQKPAKIISEEDSIDDIDDALFEETEAMLSERVERWAKELEAKGRAEGETEGRAKGEAEGRAKGRAEGHSGGLRDMLISITEKKFGQLPEALCIHINAADEQELHRISALLISASDPEELFPKE